MYDAAVARAPAACVACGRRETTPLYEVNGFAVAACACGLARTVLPDGFDPASIYTEAYFQGGQRDGYADYLGSGAELRHEFRRIVGAVKRHAPGGSLIELGCAFGFFLDEAVVAGYRACGVEISDHARSVCEARGLDVVRDATPAVLAARGPFDVAVMLDVLEHMPDPALTLDRLHAAMRPGAQLVVTTGDYGSLIARAMGRRWRLMTPPQHLWFFSAETVTRLLARHGFRVHAIEHPWKLVPLALIAYQATRYLGGQALVRRFVPPGRLPINLFDAMRVIATRVPRSPPAELLAPYVRGRVVDVAALADAELLAFHDADGFDAIVAQDALAGSRDPDLVFVRLAAALRAGGALIARLPDALRARVAGYGFAVRAELPGELAVIARA